MADTTYTIDIETREALAELKKVANGMKGVEAQAKKTGNGIANFGKSLLGLKGAITTLVGAGGLGAIVSKSLQAADTIGKVADKVGLTTDQLQELRFAATQSGVGVNTLDTSMQRFSRRIGEAAKGTGVLYKEFKDLNLPITNVDGTMRSVNDIFNDYVAAIAGAGSEQEKLRLAVAAFDSEGGNMVNMLRDGVAGLQAMRDEAPKVGRAQIDAATKANDAWGRVRASLSQLTMTLSSELAPALEQIANKLNEAFKDPERVKQLAEAMKTLGDAIIIVADVLGVVTSQLGNFAKAFVAIKLAKWLGVFKSFSGSLANISTNITKAGVTAASFGQFLAKGIGPALALTLRITAIGTAVWALTEALQGNIPWLNKFLKDVGVVGRTTQEQIAEVEAALKGGFTDRLRFFGPEGIVEYYDEDELRGILSALKDQLKQEEETAAAIAESRRKQQELLSGMSTDPAASPGFVDPKAADDLAKLKDELRDTALAFLPLKQAQEQYWADIANLQRAAKEGAISQEELTQAIVNAHAEYQKTVDDINGVTEAQKKLKEQQEEYNRELQDTLRQYSPIATKMKELERVEANLKALRAAGTVNAAQMQEAEKNLAQARKDMQREQMEASRDWADGWQLAFEDYVDSATNAAKQARSAFETATNGMEDAIVDFAKTSKFEWKGFLQSIVDDLLRSQAKQLVGNLFSGLGGLFGGGSKGFAGFFANGGKIPAGQFGVVGERGPELVEGPATVTPMGQGGNNSYTININAVDAMSFKQLVAREPEFIFAVAEQGRRNLPSAR